MFYLSLETMKSPVKMAVLASGNGSNAENLMKHFALSEIGEVRFILCNKPEAGVINRAKRAGKPVFVLPSSEFEKGDSLLNFLRNNQTDVLILAGFLRKLSPEIISAFPNKIINIHPSLLPKFGGKGMYGNHVHEEVIRLKEKESGITIHIVNEEYDKGEIIFQATCEVKSDDSVQDLANRIHELEYKHFPSVVETYLKKLLAKS